MHFFFQKQNRSLRITYLECTSYSGYVYRVIGRGRPGAMRCSLEIERCGTIHRAVLPDFTDDLGKAREVALSLLDANATPADLERMALTMMPEAALV